jgi:hypothetical protein
MANGATLPEQTVPLSVTEPDVLGVLEEDPQPIKTSGRARDSSNAGNERSMNFMVNLIDNTVKTVFMGLFLLVESLTERMPCSVKFASAT